PKPFASPGVKQVRILTDQAGFGVKYVIISSTRPKAPDEQTAKDLAKEAAAAPARSEEHTSELQSQSNLVCRLLLEKKKKQTKTMASFPLLVKYKFDRFTSHTAYRKPLCLT